MPLTPADFYEEIAGGPPGGAAWWVTTSDDIRLRVGFWPCKSPKGTVLLFPGRTEYIEKYGRAAAELTAAGYNVATLDWRGQGFSARMNKDPMLSTQFPYENIRRVLLGHKDRSEPCQKIFKTRWQR